MRKFESTKLLFVRNSIWGRNEKRLFGKIQTKDNSNHKEKKMKWNDVEQMTVSFWRRILKGKWSHLKKIHKWKRMLLTHVLIASCHLLFQKNGLIFISFIILTSNHNFHWCTVVNFWMRMNWRKITINLINICLRDDKLIL